MYENQRSLINLRFFPEGGDLIDGLASVVAFKAVGPDGQSISVSGTVVDQSQREVARFDTHHLGMGGFILKPTYGKHYTARVDLQGVALKFPLPPVQPRGYAMRVGHHAQLDEVKIAVYGSEGLEVADGQVVAHQRGAVFAAFTVQDDRPHLVVNLNRSVFPPGICHLTFFDAAGTPRCERLLFINRPAAPVVTLETISPVYGQRDSVVPTTHPARHHGASGSGTRFP